MVLVCIINTSCFSRCVYFVYNTVVISGIVLVSFIYWRHIHNMSRRSQSLYRIVIVTILLLGPYTAFAGVPTVTLTADDSSESKTIPYGTGLILAWSSTGATSCTGSRTGRDFWGGALGVSGTRGTGNLKESTTFTVTCKSSSKTRNSSSRSLSINVLPPVTPIVTLTADDQEASSSVAYGTSTILAWTASDADYCKASVLDTVSTSSSVWNGEIATEGTKKITGLTKSQTFNLSCFGPTFKVGTSSVKVIVEPPVLPEVTLLADGQEASTSITYGTSTVLSWSSTASEGCFASTTFATSSVWSGSIGTSSLAKNSENLHASELFTISCKNKFGTGTSSVLVTVSSSSDVSSSDGDIPVDVISATSSCLRFTKNLQHGVSDKGRGTSVSQLQDFLRSNNFLQIKKTGFFGVRTVQAIKKFQNKNGLPSTGTLGPVTRAKIEKISCHK